MPEWLQAVLAIMAAIGALGGTVGFFTARATRRNLDADTAVKLVEASGAVIDQIRKERQDLIRHRENCEKRLEALEREVYLLQKAP